MGKPAMKLCGLQATAIAALFGLASASWGVGNPGMPNMSNLPAQQENLIKQFIQLCAEVAPNGTVTYTEEGFELSAFRRGEVQTEASQYTKFSWRATHLGKTIGKQDILDNNITRSRIPEKMYKLFLEHSSLQGDGQLHTTGSETSWSTIFLWVIGIVFFTLFSAVMLYVCYTAFFSNGSNKRDSIEQLRTRVEELKERHSWNWDRPSRPSAYRESSGPGWGSYDLQAPGDKPRPSLNSYLESPRSTMASDLPRKERAPSHDSYSRRRKDKSDSV